MATGDAFLVILLLIIGLALLLLLGNLIACALLLTGLVVIVLLGVPLPMFSMEIFHIVDSFLLIAVPFFILAGILMREGGITRRLINFALLLFGWIPGSLGAANVVASMIFGGISGSSVADTASVGSILIPEMIEKKYDPDFSAAITAASSTIGMIIPPSIPMILYALAAEASIGRLFLAGAIPGIMVGLFQLSLVVIIAVRRGYGKEGQETRMSLLNIVQALKDGILALLMPLIIVGTIVVGMVTPTEAAAVAVVYAFLVGFFVYRELRISKLPALLLEATLSTAVVMFIVLGASVIGWILNHWHIAELISKSLLSVSSNPIILLLVINAALLLMGCVSELSVNILIFTPIFLPVIQSLGIDVIHFGAIMILNQAIALVTPPVGSCLYICSNLAKVGIEPLFMKAAPFLLANVAVLLLVTYIPPLAMFLPNFLMK